MSYVVISRHIEKKPVDVMSYVVVIHIATLWCRALSSGLLLFFWFELHTSSAPQHMTTYDNI